MTSDPRGAYLRYDVRDAETDELIATGVTSETVETIAGTHPSIVRIIPAD